MTFSVILTAQMIEVSCVVLALMWSIVVLPPLLYFSAVKTIQALETECYWNDLQFTWCPLTSSSFFLLAHCFVHYEDTHYSRQ